MAECPICEAEDYTWLHGCRECGYYDEDGHRQYERDTRMSERKIRKDRRQFG